MNNEQDKLIQGQKRGDGYLDTLISEFPALTKVFSGLAAGETPDFLTVMAAIEDIVAFTTECDSNSRAAEPAEQNMSRNKCRFCS